MSSTANAAYSVESSATNAAVKANLDSVKETVIATPVKSPAANTDQKTKKSVIKKRSAMQTMKVNSLSGQPLPEAPTLKNAEFDNYVEGDKKNSTVNSATTAQERKLMGKDRNFSDPMKDRWVNDLSGPKARVSFDKFRHNDNCQLAGTCERAPAPSDLNVAGVVVDSDQLRRPADTMLDGSLKRGHYINNTPAVYLK